MARASFAPRGRPWLALVLVIGALGLTALVLHPWTRLAAPAGGTALGAPPLGSSVTANGPVMATPTAPLATVTPAATVVATVDPWAPLAQRSLAIPTLASGSACPRTEGKRVLPAFSFAIGAGAAYVTGFGPDGAYAYQQFSNVPAGYRETVWLVDGTYQGPLLIRGRQLDGSHTLRFGTGPREQLPELRLGGPDGVRGEVISNAQNWRTWRAYTIAPTPGCYAYQVDGIGFSETIVFQVVPGQPGDLLPLPSIQSLPNQLSVTSAAPLAPNHVRLALTGANFLVLRIDVAPSSTTPLPLAGPAMRQTTTPQGPAVWQADPQYGWPRVVNWDDGRHRYVLTVLDGGPGAWSETDLVALLAAFANAR